MMTPLFFAAAAALLMFGLLIEAKVLRALHDDPPSLYRLFAVRDTLVRLVIDGHIKRDEQHFCAIYANVNILLKGCRRLSGPDGWRRAEVGGEHLAQYPRHHLHLVDVPREDAPRVLEPVVGELRDALMHLLENHYGLFLAWGDQRRKLIGMRKERARELLRMMPASASAPPS